MNCSSFTYIGEIITLKFLTFLLPFISESVCVENYYIFSCVPFVAFNSLTHQMASFGLIAELLRNVEVSHYISHMFGRWICMTPYIISCTLTCNL